MHFELYEPVNDDPSDNGPDLADLECRCPNPDDQYLMEVECGSVHFTHAACGKPPGEWADDAFSLPPVAVTLRWTAITDHWAGDVDAYGDLTINGLAPQVSDTTTKEN